jgi:dTDP-4-dehydrorhamnose reductase
MLGLDLSLLGACTPHTCTRRIIIGTYNKRKPVFNFPLVALSNTDQDQVLELLEREQVTAVVNMTRGEDEIDFTMHRKLIDFGNSHGVHYFYASSFNACDAQLAEDHRESELPSAQSDYGKFKARCEQALMSDSKRFAIFRFSATHGWAPNRCARTEDFLKKVSSGEKVTVHQGIMQNRTAVTDLAGMMAAVIVAKGEGVFHLGTVDASDEIDFLRRLAREFGYDDSLVIPGDASPTNANMVPGKILRMFGNEFFRTETDTITSVGRVPELAPYRRFCS